MEIVKMNGKEAEQEQRNTDINLIPISPYTETRKASMVSRRPLIDEKKLVSIDEEKKNAGQSFVSFLYNSRKKTVLGRSALNWGKSIFIYLSDSFFFLF
jgi:hypothetical protein